MSRVRAISGRGCLALVCSLLMVYEPVAGSSGSFWRDDTSASHSAPATISGPIALAKLTGTADRNGTPLLNGSVIVTGDSLQTHTNSAVLLTAAPGERLWLGPNTSVKLTKEAATVGVSLERGSVGLETHGHIQVTLDNHDGLTLRSRPDSAVRAQLSFVNHQEAQVRVQEGSLEMVQGGRSILLRPVHTSALSASRLRGERSPAGEAPARGQSDNGSIVGTVVSTDLFAIPDASVTLTNAAGKTFTTTSDQEGKFAFNDIPPGTYTLHVTKSGYQNYDLPNVAVRSGNESSLYVQLGGGGLKKAGSNSILIWVLVGAGAAGAIGAIAASRGSKSNTSPSSLVTVE